MWSPYWSRHNLIMPLYHISNISKLGYSSTGMESSIYHANPQQIPKDYASNHRPILLTSIPCKIMEHIILHYLNEALDKILHHWQHGFRKWFSCETQLWSTYHDTVKATQNSSTTHAVILDFRKAFDKVAHALRPGHTVLTNPLQARRCGIPYHVN